MDPKGHGDSGLAPFTWTILRQDGLTKVRLRGRITEHADMDGLVKALANDQFVRFDLAEIKGINSVGIREWLGLMRGVAEHSKLELERCSPVLVAQMNMIHNFIGDACVLSVFAPFACEQCEREVAVLIDVSSGELPQLEPPTCEHDACQMEFDDLEDVYFSFLNRQR